MSKAIVNSCRDCTARCCRGLAVVLTIPEALRLVKATGAKPEDILEFSENVDSRKTPHYPLLLRQGKSVREFFIIIRRQGADCIFLNEDRTCKIYAHRPFVCKLYPLELDGKCVKKGALCPMKFEMEEGMEGDAKRLSDDLYSHGVMARKWSATHSEAPDMKKLMEYFAEKGNAI